MHISQYKSNKINPKSKISRSKIFIILKNTRREEDKRSPPLAAPSVPQSAAKHLSEQAHPAPQHPAIIESPHGVGA